MFDATERRRRRFFAGRGGGVASIAGRAATRQFGRVDVCRPAAIGQGIAAVTTTRGSASSR